MKKIVFIVLGVLCILLIVSCGYNEAKQKADEKLKKYKPAFEQAVKDAYGKDAKLTNVKCDVNGYTDGAFQTSFSASGLEGTLKLNGSSYKVYYNDLDNSIVDNVHSEAINNEIRNALPFDSSKYIDVRMNELYLDPSIDSLDKYLESDNIRIDVFITTTEDMSNYKTVDVDSNTVFKKIKDNDCGLNIKAACLNDKSRSDALLLNIKTLDFSSDSHPKANDSSGKSKDAFDVYGIKNVIVIDYPNGNMFGNIISYME